MSDKEMFFIPRSEEAETQSVTSISTLSSLQGKVIPTPDGSCFFQIYTCHPYTGQITSLPIYFTGEDFSKICEEVGVHKNEVYVCTREFKGSEIMPEKGYFGMIIGNRRDLFSV